LLPQPIARQLGRCTHRNAAALGLVAGVLLHPAVGHLLVCRDKREWGTGDVVSENEWLNACAAPRCVPSRRYHIANHMSPQSQIQHLLPHSNSRKKCRLPFHTPYSCEVLNLPAPAGLYSGPDTSYTCWPWRQMKSARQGVGQRAHRRRVHEASGKRIPHALGSQVCGHTAINMPPTKGGNAPAQFDRGEGR
jgi:hypothetical protein